MSGLVTAGFARRRLRQLRLQIVTMAALTFLGCCTLVTLYGASFLSLWPTMGAAAAALTVAGEMALTMAVISLVYSIGVKKI